MAKQRVFLGLLSTVAVVVHGKESFVNRIPNGDKVKGVDALGHKDPTGGGALNKFGEDFDSAGRTWTKNLCQLDSDGDGQTNGQELGDPCCDWTTSKVLQYTDGLSHPGDATKKADPTLWSSITCGAKSTTTDSPSTALTSTTAPTPSTTQTATTTSSTPAPTSTAAALVLSLSLACLVASVLLVV